MQPQQFAAIYQHLMDDARELPHHKMFGLSAMGAIGAVEAILYLPLYSLGMAAHGMEARIAYLKAKADGRDLAFFASSPLETLEAICDERYREQVRFGDFFIRLYEIRQRAKMILALGVEQVEATLALPAGFPTEAEFKRVLTQDRYLPDVVQPVAEATGWQSEAAGLHRRPAMRSMQGARLRATSRTHARLRRWANSGDRPEPCKRSPAGRLS